VVPRVDARSNAPHIATRRSRPIARMTRTEVTLAVDFACEGCAASVRRIAERIEGVREVEIDVEAKRCVVRGDALDAEDVLARVRKCGRATTLLME
jgi:copper chaperone CopZ